MKTLLSLLSTAVLRSAFVEPDAQVRATMWRPWLTFLKGDTCYCRRLHSRKLTSFTVEFPSAWELEASNHHEQTQDLEDDRGEDDEDDEEEDSEEPRPASEPSSRARTSTAFSDLLQFLELGCAGAPV